ncbi:ABC transporter ATP-binding protein [Halalkalibacter oceani]|uniref:ABC transporter ATP-binding protein n=1 Tax=Halalkalibacter oceani TaxID=1653776 RepID=UPI0033976B2B
MNSSNALLEVSRLSVDLGENRLIDDVTFNINKNEVFCLVGESGSGKSLTSRAIMGLLAKRKWNISGNVQLEACPSNLTTLSEKHWQDIRGKEIAMIYQNPTQALHPFLKIKSQMIQQLKSTGMKSKKEMNNRILQQLDDMNFPEPDQIANAYPCQLSGGMNQRVMIALALLRKPRLLIADEPTTGLDTINQQLIINHLLQLKKRNGMSILFITHDLRLVNKLANKVAVMRKGKIVEAGALTKIKNEPDHPYTKELWKQIPRLYERREASDH